VGLSGLDQWLAKAPSSRGNIPCSQEMCAVEFHLARPAHLLGSKIFSQISTP